MKESDDLFRLIQSLTKNEKGYFKKISSIHAIGGQNKYIALFDAIEKQKEYDEQALRKKFAGEKFIRQLHVAKNYLYNLILKTVEEFYGSVGVELRSYINRIEFLFHKGLHPQCEKIVKKAIELAVRYEYYPELYSLLEWHIRLASYTFYPKNTAEKISVLFENILSVTSEMQRTQKLHQLMLQLNLRMTAKGFLRNKNDLKIYSKIISNPLLKSDKKLKSTLQLYYFNTSLGIYSHLKKDLTASHHYTKKVVEILEKNIHLSKNDPSWYISAIRNLSITQMGYKKYDDALATINSLKHIETRSVILKKIIDNISISITLEAYIGLGDFEKGTQTAYLFLEKKENEIHKLTRPILAYLSAYTYFGAGEYSNSLKCLGLIINDPVNDVRSDIYCYSKILFLIIHFEMKHDDILDTIIKSTYRYVYKRGGLYKFELALLDFMRKKLPKVNSNSELITAFGKLKNELIKITKDPKEQFALGFFDLISWLESKIQKKSFATLYKSKRQ